MKNLGVRDGLEEANRGFDGDAHYEGVKYQFDGDANYHCLCAGVNCPLLRRLLHSCCSTGCWLLHSCCSKGVGAVGSRKCCNNYDMADIAADYTTDIADSNNNSPDYYISGISFLQLPIPQLDNRQFVRIGSLLD